MVLVKGIVNNGIVRRKQINGKIAWKYDSFIHSLVHSFVSYPIVACIDERLLCSHSDFHVHCPVTNYLSVNIPGAMAESKHTHTYEITTSLQDPRGVVRVVFASVAMGMGVDLQGVNSIIHYGAPSSIEDYFQASGRGGRSGDSAHSTIYWEPKDCPMRKEPSTTHHRELIVVRKYLENSSVCRRKWLLEHFDPNNAKPGDDAMVCCDVCATREVTQNSLPGCDSSEEAELLMRLLSCDSPPLVCSSPDGSPCESTPLSSHTV